jgi:hypothetical protein
MTARIRRTLIATSDERWAAGRVSSDPGTLPGSGLVPYSGVSSRLTRGGILAALRDRSPSRRLSIAQLVGCVVKVTRRPPSAVNVSV